MSGSAPTLAVTSRQQPIDGQEWPKALLRWGVFWFVIKDDRSWH